jgi:hypothetical protein
MSNQIENGFCEILYRKSDDNINLSLSDIKHIDVEKNYQPVGIIPLVEIDKPYELYKLFYNENNLINRKIREYDLISIYFNKTKAVVSFLVIDLNGNSNLLGSDIVIESEENYPHGIYRIPYRANKIEFQSFD